MYYRLVVHDLGTSRAMERRAIYFCYHAPGCVSTPTNVFYSKQFIVDCFLIWCIILLRCGYMTSERFGRLCGRLLLKKAIWRWGVYPHRIKGKLFTSCSECSRVMTPVTLRTLTRSLITFIPPAKTFDAFECNPPLSYPVGSWIC